MIFLLVNKHPRNHAFIEKGERMLRVVLKYSNWLQDGRKVFRVLAAHKVEILHTWSFLTMYPRVTIRIKDYDKLNAVLYDLNKQSSYEVRVVKVKKEK